MRFRFPSPLLQMPLRSFSGTSILIQQTHRSGAPVHAHAVGMSLQEPAMNCHEILHAGFPQMLLPSREDA
jgi:hypothetical protein